MQKALRIRTTVQPSDKVEIASPEPEVGRTVEIMVLHESNQKGSSIMEILNSGLERQLFQAGEEVNAYLTLEKASWDR